MYRIIILGNVRNQDQTFHHRHCRRVICCCSIGLLVRWKAKFRGLCSCNNNHRLKDFRSGMFTIYSNRGNKYNVMSMNYVVFDSSMAHNHHQQQHWTFHIWIFRVRIKRTMDGPYSRICQVTMQQVQFQTISNRNQETLDSILEICKSTSSMRAAQRRCLSI